MPLSVQERTLPVRLPLRRNRPLHGFIAALLVSMLGDNIYALALPWLVYNLTGSALAMGTMFAVGQLPVLINPFLGTLVDRWDRRRLLVAADLIRAAGVGVVPLLWFTHTLALWHLFVLGAVLTLLGQIYNTCTFAITPLVVPDSDLPALNSIFLSLMSVSNTIGPAVAGLLIALVGAPMALLADGISFLATVLALVWFRPGTAPRHAGGESTGFLAQTWSGMRYYVTHRVLLPLGLYMMLANLGFWLLFSQLIYYYRHDLNLSAPTIGLLFAGIGLGSTVVTLTGPYLMRHLPWRVIMVAARGTTGVAMIGHAFARGLVPLFATGMVGASVDMYSAVVSNTLRQRIIPREMLGRVHATHTLFCFGANPLAALASGLVVAAWGAPAVIVMGGAILLLSTLVVIFTPLGQVHAGTGVAGA